MKKYVIVIFVFSLLTACNEGANKSDKNEEPLSREADFDKNISDETPRADKNTIDFDASSEIDKNESNPEADENATVSNQKSVKHNLVGKFRKIEDAENTARSDCSIFEVTYTGTSQLCVAPNNIYISVKFKKTGGDSADVYLVEPIKTQNLEREIPWEDFDRNTPIATLKMAPDGAIELDWKGFSIDGELAMDYAIYGKKALEGTYKRE